MILYLKAALRLLGGRLEVYLRTVLNKFRRRAAIGRSDGLAYTNHKGEIKQGISPEYERDRSDQMVSMRIPINAIKQQKDIKSNKIEKNKTFSFERLVKDLVQNKTRK